MSAIAASLRFSSRNTWPILPNGTIVGTMTVAETNGGAIGHCRLADIVDDSRSEMLSELLEAAVKHARDSGCLKITVHAPSPYYRKTDFLRSLGLHYAGTRPSAAMFSCEFYIDLYHRPETKRPMSHDSPSNQAMSVVGA